MLDGGAKERGPWAYDALVDFERHLLADDLEIRIITTKKELFVRFQDIRDRKSRFWGCHGETERKG